MLNATQPAAYPPPIQPCERTEDGRILGFDACWFCGAPIGPPDYPVHGENPKETCAPCRANWV